MEAENAFRGGLLLKVSKESLQTDKAKTCKKFTQEMYTYPIII